MPKRTTGRTNYCAGFAAFFGCGPKVDEADEREAGLLAHADGAAAGRAVPARRVEMRRPVDPRPFYKKILEHGILEFLQGFAFNTVVGQALGLKIDSPMLASIMASMGPYLNGPVVGHILQTWLSKVETTAADFKDLIPRAIGLAVSVAVGAALGDTVEEFPGGPLADMAARGGIAHVVGKAVERLVAFRLNAIGFYDVAVEVEAEADDADAEDGLGLLRAEAAGGGGGGGGEEGDEHKDDARAATSSLGGMGMGGH